MRTTINNVINDVVSEQQHEKERITPQEIGDDQMPSNEKYGKDQILLKKQETQGNDEDSVPSTKNEDEGRVPTIVEKRKSKQKLCQELYDNVCAFDNTYQMNPFNKQTSEVAVGIRLNSSRTCPVICVFDTGFWLNLLHEDMAELDAISPVRVSKQPQLRTAANQNTGLFFTIKPHVYMGEIPVRVVYGIVKIFVAPVLFGSSFVEITVKGIFTIEWKIVWYTFCSW